ncbi:unnamed protein product [Phytophthora fragariaefolia]|uniref:Unnamed protein product n=1 Tax=Phytophthora fragariaefolia TaxID=1490495 RepID=A0A9W6UCA3_9STRA|nr:unnamed protein product [Phytophthora fragariaefolia]
MARWLSFFAEYNFTVEYKPGKQNVLADALSQRPDYELAHLTYLESPLYELISGTYADDDDLAGLVGALRVPNKTIELTARQRSRLHRHSVVEGLLYYQVDGGDEPRIVVPSDEDLRHRVLYGAHDTPLSGHLGREKTYTSEARNFWWPHMYKWVRYPRGLKGLRTSVKPNLLSFIETGEAVRQRVRDAMAAAQDRQKENSDRHRRVNTQVFQVGDQVLLNAKTLPIAAVSAVDSTKLRPRFIGPFTVIGVHGHAYTLDLPSAMATHPTFYVGLLKPYHPAAAIDPSGYTPPSIDEGLSPSLPAVPPSQEPGLGGSRNKIRLAARVTVLQGTDTRVERPDPAEMLG